MANGRITSGTGTGTVKTYRQVRGEQKILVSGLKVEGAEVIVKLGPAGVGTIDPPPTTGSTAWSQYVPAGVGTHSLIVKIKKGDMADKDFTQEIIVVAG